MKNMVRLFKRFLCEIHLKIMSQIFFSLRGFPSFPFSSSSPFFSVFFTMSVALPLPRFPSSYPSLFLPFLPFPLPFFPTRKSRSSPQPFAVPSHPFVRLTRFPSSSVPLCYPPLPSVPLPPSPPLCPPLPHLTSPLSPSASPHPPPFPSSLPLCPPLSPRPRGKLPAISRHQTRCPGSLRWVGADVVCTVFGYHYRCHQGRPHQRNQHGHCDRAASIFFFRSVSFCASFLFLYFC